MKTQKTPLFQGIGETALAEMFTCGGARCKTYAKGEVLLRAGCITREVGIVQTGGVNIENIDLWGNRSILSYVPAGQVFAETYAFCGEPMMVDVVAAEETEVLFLNMDVLIHTPHPDSEWQPVLMQNLLNISLHKNLALSERIFCTAPKTVRGRLLLYLTFFPKAAQGPLCRYGEFSAQLDARAVTADNLNAGGTRLIFGLGKKALLSSAAGAIAQEAFSLPSSALSPVYAWTGAICYALQIYFDFSGYTDLALGLALLFGFTLPENFDHPYMANSVTDFWRRWHMSLSSWFRDYVYIPLGGSRCRLRRTCLNLLIVFALTGLWHGAAWQYVVFGLLHGIILCMERLGLRRALEQLPRLFRHLYTVVLLWLTLVVFGAPGLSEGLAVLKGIFTWQSGAKGYTLAAFADTKLLLILAASFLLCGPVQALCPKLKAALYAKKAPSPAGMAGLLVLLFLGLMRVTAGTYSAFIYFQF